MASEVKSVLGFGIFEPNCIWFRVELGFKSLQKLIFNFLGDEEEDEGEEDETDNY